MEYEVWHDILTKTNFIVFFLFFCAVSYLFIFAIFSFKKQKVNFKKTKKKYQYLIVISTHQVDENIFKSINSFLNQTFPANNYDIVVVCRSLSESSRKAFETLPIKFITCLNKERCRSQMLQSALKQIDSDYDVVVIMKSGDTVDTNFLEEINKACNSEEMAIQTHRVTKNIHSNIAILNALSEEINNSIFRRGHVNLGFSSGLIGSGMVFNYKWFKQNIDKVKQNGLTKQLEILLLKQGIFIEYLEKLYTYDERNRSVSESNRQREYWYSAKFCSLGEAIKDLPKALFAGNFDLSDKIIQWMIPSKFILLFAICLIAILLLFIDWILSLKWFVLLFFLLLVFDLSIPTRFHNSRSFFAMFSLPILFISNFINYFRSGKK
jgi:hypothetical protein